MSTLRVDNLLNSAGNESPISVPGAAKAWVCFNGTTGTQGQNDVSIRSSFNVSSVTDHSTGEYTVNFATAFSDANYATVALTTVQGTTTTNGGWNVALSRTTVPATTGVRLETFNASVFADALHVGVAIFR